MRGRTGRRWGVGICLGRRIRGGINLVMARWLCLLALLRRRGGRVQGIVLRAKSLCEADAGSSAADYAPLRCRYGVRDRTELIDSLLYYPSTA